VQLTFKYSQGQANHARFLQKNT